MEIRQATNFLEVLELQKILDSKIKSSRERDLTDIKLSIIAEIIEFNEECEKDTHKTWKTKNKVFTLEKAKKEAIDILFFIAQLVNRFSKDKEIIREVVDCFGVMATLDLVVNIDLKVETMWLIKCISHSRLAWKIEDWTRIIESLNKIYFKLGMTEEEIYKRHFEKWKENYHDRVGKEWN